MPTAPWPVRPSSTQPEMRTSTLGSGLVANKEGVGYEGCSRQHVSTVNTIEAVYTCKLRFE
jgi:hypothetical protein